MKKIRKGLLNNKLVDIVSIEEYNENKDIYDPSCTAIEDNNILYPIINRPPIEDDKNNIGCYDMGGLYQFNRPSKEDESEYKADGKIINFSDTKGIEDLIKRTLNYKELEKEILTDDTGVTMFKEDSIEDNEPNMRALKKAINLKKINIDNYKERCPKFINDRRLFQKKSITLNKELAWADILDIKATLILEDKNPDVPNPMGSKVVVELNSDGEDQII